MTTIRETANEIRRYDILVNTGYRYEYFMSTEATSVAKARRWFERYYEGHHYADDFKVRLVKPILT